MSAIPKPWSWSLSKITRGKMWRAERCAGSLRRSCGARHLSWTNLHQQIEKQLRRVRQSGHPCHQFEENDDHQSCHALSSPLVRPRHGVYDPGFPAQVSWAHRVFSCTVIDCSASITCLSLASAEVTPDVRRVIPNFGPNVLSFCETRKVARDHCREKKSVSDPYRSQLGKLRQNCNQLLQC